MYVYRCVYVYTCTGRAVRGHVQGALYVVLGENKRLLVTKRNWDVITRLCVYVYRCVYVYTCTGSAVRGVG